MRMMLAAEEKKDHLELAIFEKKELLPIENRKALHKDLRRFDLDVYEGFADTNQEFKSMNLSEAFGAYDAARKPLKTIDQAGREELKELMEYLGEDQQTKFTTLLSSNEPDQVTTTPITLLPISHNEPEPGDNEAKDNAEQPAAEQEKVADVQKEKPEDEN